MKNLVCTFLLLIVALHDDSAQLQLAIEPVVTGFTRLSRSYTRPTGRLFIDNAASGFSQKLKIACK